MLPILLQKRFMLDPSLILSTDKFQSQLLLQQLTHKSLLEFLLQDLTIEAMEILHVRLLKDAWRVWITLTTASP